MITVFCCLNIFRLPREFFKRLELGGAMELLQKYAVGIRPLDDPMFAEGDNVCQIYKRKGIDNTDDQELCRQMVRTFKCHIPTCHMEFDTVIKFELHYNSCHRYACSVCKKQLPSPHLLDLHVSEAHDAFFSVASVKKPMYQCFVETCKDLFMTPSDRRKHCIEIHLFPHDFRFDQRYKKKNKTNNPSTRSKQETDPSTSGKQEVKSSGDSDPPREFAFGHKKYPKSFKGPTKKTIKEDTINVQDLMEVLPTDQ